MKLTDKQEWVIKALGLGPFITHTIPEVCEQLDRLGQPAPREGVSQTLASLVRREIVTRRRAGRLMTYRLTEHGRAVDYALCCEHV